MAEAVPLCAALCVEGVEVVIGETGAEGFYGVLEGFAVEGGLGGLVEGEIDGDGFAGADVGFGGEDAGGGEEV